MNLILFQSEEISRPLPRSDPRARHLLEVLRRREGDEFDVGLIDGPRGKARVQRIAADALTLSFAWGEPPPPLDPITLIVGLPRPQTARKVLQEATALGVGSLHFVTTEKGEANYTQSTLWSTGEWRRHVIAGAEQAFCTRLPRVRWGHDLAQALADLPTASVRLALDVYEATEALRAEHGAAAASLVLALGPERGWSARERTALRDAGFALAHLGPRVLRVETALVAALAIVQSGRR